MSSLAAVGAPAPKGAPSTAAKAVSDGGGAFGPALTLARELLDPPTARPGAGSRAIPGPARPVDPATTGPGTGEPVVAASGVVPGPVQGSSLASPPLGLSVPGAEDSPDKADLANQVETDSTTPEPTLTNGPTLAPGHTLAHGLPENRATFLNRAVQGARIEASAAHVPTGLPPTPEEHAPQPAVTAAGPATAGSLTASAQSTSVQAPSVQSFSVQAAPAQTSLTQTPPTPAPTGSAPVTSAPPAVAAQAVPVPGAPQRVPGAEPQGMPLALTVPGAGPTRLATPAAESSAAATLQPVVPGAQPPAHHTTAVPAAASAPPAQAPSVPLATQLYKPVFSLASASKGEHLITVRVAPDEFGPVTVRALVTAEGMRVELFAPTEAAREALRGMLPDLRRDLAVPGLHASLDVSTKDQPGGGDSARGDADGQGPARQDHARPDRIRESAAPPGRPTDSPSSQDPGLTGGTSWNRSTLDLLA